MQLRFTIRGLMEFTALIAATLAIDAYCWRRLFGGPSPPWVMRDSVSWVLVAWGSASGVYLVWRFTSGWGPLWFVPGSVAMASAITLANLLAVIVLPFGIPEPQNWYFYLAIIALVPTSYAAVASLVLSVGIAFAMWIKNYHLKATQ